MQWFLIRTSDEVLKIIKRTKKKSKKVKTTTDRKTYVGIYQNVYLHQILQDKTLNHETISTTTSS